MSEYGEPTWLRIPQDLKDKLWKLAKAENRTLGAQIVVLLERTPEMKEQQPPAAAQKAKGAGK